MPGATVAIYEVCKKFFVLNISRWIFLKFIICILINSHWNGII